MNEFAPVLIPTLNRHIHFKKCVESLARCTHAEKTDLFIALDYPFHEGHWQGYEKIKKYLPTITGFKSINIIVRNKNFGISDNTRAARKVIFANYDKIIFSEDDNVFSHDFIDFINKGLCVYEIRDDIYSISGYNYPIAVPASYNKDIYIWQGFSAWGVGTWKEKSEKIDWSVANLKIDLSDSKHIKGLNNIAGHYVPHLKKIIETGYITGDTMICYHLYKNAMYSVFPVVSRVRNIGNDGSGLHCGKNNFYKNQPIYHGTKKAEMPLSIESDILMNKILKTYFQINIKRKIIRYINRFWFSMIGCIGKD